MEDQKCPKCDSEMERGLLSSTARWIKGDSFSGQLSKLVNWGINAPRVWAWRCPNCKVIQLVSE